MEDLLAVVIALDLYPADARGLPGQIDAPRTAGLLGAEDFLPAGDAGRAVDLHREGTAVGALDQLAGALRKVLA